MASPKDKDPKGPKDGDPTPVTSERKGGEGSQDDPPRVSDDEDKVQAMPPILDLSKKGDEQSKGNSESTEHPDGASEVTGSSNTKRYSKCTQDQAGYYKKNFDSLLYKLLRSLLEFRH